MRNSSSWGTSLPGSAAVGLAEDMFVETHLTGGLLGVVVGADPEFEESHVVCRQFDPDFDHLVDFVLANDDSVPKFAPCLVRSWLQIICKHIIEVEIWTSILANYFACHEVYNKKSRHDNGPSKNAHRDTIII